MKIIDKEKRIVEFDKNEAVLALSEDFTISTMVPVPTPEATGAVLGYQTMLITSIALRLNELEFLQSLMEYFRAKASTLCYDVTPKEEGPKDESSSNA